MASLQAELQEVKRKGEVAVTSLEAKVTASPCWTHTDLLPRPRSMKTRLDIDITKVANQVILHEEVGEGLQMGLGTVLVGLPGHYTSLD